MMGKLKKMIAWLLGECNVYGHDWKRWGIGYMCKRCKRHSDNKS